MKRKVKFRGKSQKTGEWLYGDLVRNVEGAFAVVPPFEMTTNNLCDRYEVEEETIGQFTRMYDSAGREIYEGDILMCKAGHFVVQIDTDAARFMASPAVLYNSVFFNEASFTLSYNSISYWFSICGNIHDNAELLK